MRGPFNRNFRKRFLKRNSYFLHDEIGNRLLDRVLDIKSGLHGDVLELDSLVGARLLGLNSNLPLIKNIKSFTTVNSSLQVLEQAASIKFPSVKATKTKLLDIDEEMNKFDTASYDVILSNLALHWVNDLPTLFEEVQRILKPGGFFLGNLFGSSTLFELRSSLILAEDERLGGVSPHTSPLIHERDVARLLPLKDVTVDSEEVIIKYPEIFTLMDDLNGMGENNSLLNIPALSRASLIASSSIYSALYGDEQGDISATFNIINFIGWKPH